MAPEAALAQAQPYQDKTPAPAWTLDVGGGAVRGFSPTGQSGDGYKATPWVSATLGERIYVNGLDGVGWNLVDRNRLRAGAQLRPRYAAGDIEGLNLDRPGFGADAALYAFARLPGDVVIGGRISQDVSGGGAGLQYFGSMGMRRTTPVGLATLSGYVVGGDAARNDRYLGVSSTEAASSGFRAFEAGEGVSSAGAALSLVAPVGYRFGVGAFVNYEERLGASRNSPLIDDTGIWRSGLIVVYRFRAD